MASPLLLEPFEEYMLLDDRPNYPMNVFARLRFVGEIDFAAAEAAFTEVVARHPMCRVRVATGARGQFHWSPVETHVSFHRDAACCGEGFPPAEPIDLYAESGLRVVVGASGNRSTAVFQVHHACCDGIALCQIVEDWLIAYDRRMTQGQSSATLRTLDESKLAGRGRFGLTTWQLWSRPRHHLHGLERVRKFFMHRTARLVAREPDAEPSTAFPASTGAVIEPAVVEALRDESRRQDATLNDLLLCKLFLAIVGFQSQSKEPPDRGWLRIAVPINLRRAADRDMPAANVVSMVFLDRRRRDAADPAGLLAGLNREMNVVKRHNLGLTFVTALHLVKRLPGGIDRMTSPGKCSATCVLSNLGDVLAGLALPSRAREIQFGKIQAGNMLLESFDFLPPIRPGTAAAFGVCSFAGSLRIALHFDARLLTSADAERLLNGYVEQLNRRAISPAVAGNHPAGPAEN